MQCAEVAELADALDLGSSTFGVQVQFLSSAPFLYTNTLRLHLIVKSFFASKKLLHHVYCYTG